MTAITVSTTISAHSHGYMECYTTAEGGKEIQDWFPRGLAEYVGATWEVDGGWIISLTQQWPWQTVVKNDLPNGRSLKTVHLVIFFVCKVKYSKFKLYTDSWMMANSLANSLGTWKQKDWKVRKRTSWGRGTWVCIQQWARSVHRRSLYHTWTLNSNHLPWEAVNSKVDNDLFSQWCQPALVISHPSTEKNVTMVTEVEVMHFSNNVDSHSPKMILLL